MRFNIVTQNVIKIRRNMSMVGNNMHLLEGLWTHRVQHYLIGRNRNSKLCYNGSPCQCLIVWKPPLIYIAFSLILFFFSPVQTR